MKKNHSKRYRLIREYPNSPELGTIIQWVKGTNLYSYEENNIYLKEIDPEFWEEVVEKDYKVLSFELNKKIFKLAENKNKYFAEDGNYANYVEMLSDNRIISICRISDNEIFTIRDKAKQSNVAHNNTFTITGFELDVNKKHLLVLGNGGIRLSKMEKVKEPLFTTQDGVDIFKGDEVVCFDKDSFCIRNKTYLFKEYDKNDRTYLFFSTLEKAEEYVLMNKPCLSIKEICPIIGQCNNTTYIDLNQLTEKLKELVKSKL